MRAIVAGIALATAAAICSALPAVAQGDDQPIVSMDKIAFEPQTLTVQAGTTVTWVNGNITHTVTADDGTFDSGFLGSGETFDVLFDTPGSYPYFCLPHGGPGGIGMAGTIVVVPANS